MSKLNDHDSRERSDRPDPYGQASYQLIESLIHGLVANGHITLSEALEVVDIAREAQADVSAQDEESFVPAREPLSILDDLSASLHALGTDNAS